jgi:ribosomal protein S16
MFQLSTRLLLRRMFAPYYSKERGPPRIRFQACGLKSRPFYKLVACNQRDPRDGKHMEVLGAYTPKARQGVKEIRLRFSRAKFWLAAGADFTGSCAGVLALAGIIPPPPPQFGRRTKGHYGKLREVMEQRQLLHELAIEKYHQGAASGGPEVPVAGGEHRMGSAPGGGGSRVVH